MLVGPKPDHHYRRTDTKQLIPPGGSFEADPCDLDIIRALECGDLVAVESSLKPKRAGKSRSAAGPETPAEPDAGDPQD